MKSSLENITFYENFNPHWKQKIPLFGLIRVVIDSKCNAPTIFDRGVKNIKSQAYLAYHTIPFLALILGLTYYFSKN